jgi:23S rRNA (cytosine1962-C5)-methyltransferase
VINHKVPLPVPAGEIAQVLLALFPFQVIVLKSHQSLPGPEAGKVRVLYGDAGDGVVKVRENGACYFADTLSLHSNGLYLDARPLRAWLKTVSPEHATGRRILNLFAHTGSLGIAARLGGAREVVHLDKSREAMERIRYNYEWNGLTPDSRGMLRGDLYFHLPRAVKWGQTFDGIILDPPPKVPPPPHAPKHRPAGQDFETLIELCCRLLAPGAWLAALCHDFRTTRERFEEQITRASGGRLVPGFRTESEADFPEPDPERRTRITVFTSV